MKFTTSFLTIAAAGLSLASPSRHREQKRDINHPQVRAEMEAARTVALEKLDDVEKRVCCGLYICDGFDFTGNCYWACYPVAEHIELDEYFQNNIGSWGPDEGCSCYPNT